MAIGLSMGVLHKIGGQIPHSVGFYKDKNISFGKFSASITNDHQCLYPKMKNMG